MGYYDKKEKGGMATLPARCAVTREEFDIAVERRQGKLILTEGVKKVGIPGLIPGSSHSADKKDGMKSIQVDEGVFTGKTYHCPVCGNKDIVRCGKCHNITCYDGSGTFVCAHCGNNGKVSGTIQQIHVRDSNYPTPPAGDKPYRPGDKPYHPGDKPYSPGDKGDK